MIRILLFLLLSVSLEAKSVEIFGSNATYDNTVSKVYNSLFIKDNLILNSDEVIYYKNRKYIVAKGRVYVTYSNNSFILSNLAQLNLDNKNMDFYPFFIFDSNTDLWLSSLSAKKRDKLYGFKNILSSSCSVKYPDWKIVASSGDYNKQSKWVNLYNPTFYIHNVPVLYLPYLGFSNDHTRRRGFLRPLFGYSVNEGFLYSQPYYIPFSKSSDLELIPSIRSFRGRGIYTNYRFMDSASSGGSLKLGIFKDFPKYVEKYNLKNSIHRGFNLKYLNRKLFSEKDDLWLDLNYANDSSFYYLDSYNNSFNKGYITDKIVTSKLNWIYNDNNKNFYGVYGRYFIDTSKLDNSDTMQILPEIQYHRFSENLFFKKLIYNADFDVKNYNRKKGDRFLKKSAFIPLSYNFSFFDDYLKLNLSENMYAGGLYNYTTKKEEVKQISLYSIWDVYSSLSKEIGEELYHNIRLDTIFFVQQRNEIKGSSYLMQDTETQNSITFKINQYFSGDVWNLNHRVSQTIYEDKSKSNIFNEVDSNIYNFFMKDNNQYSQKLKRVYYNNFSFGYNNEIFNIVWNHIYKYDVSKSYSLKTGVKFSKYHRLYGSYNYDYERREITKWNLGISMAKKCWNYDLKFSQEKLPILTNDGISNIKQNTIYFGIEFNPIGGFEQSFTYKDNK